MRNDKKSSAMHILERGLIEVTRAILTLGIIGFFGYVAYKVVQIWGSAILALAGFGLVFYGVFHALPVYIAKKHGLTRWEAGKRVNLWLLFVGSALIGAFWIPTAINFGRNWYWRIVLGFIFGWLALITPRY